MPAYNAEATLERSVRSVLAQTVLDWELVIVDDGSVDGTFELATRLAEQDRRIALLQQENAGAGPARNRGILESTTEFVTLLDADDQMFPEYLERISELIAQYPGFSVYGCNAQMEFPDGSRRRMFTGDRPGSRRVREISLAEVIMSTAVVPAFSTMRRLAYQDVGGYRAVFSEDYDLWLRMLATGHRILRTSDPLINYVWSATNKTMSGHLRMMKSTLRVVGDLCESSGLPDGAQLTCKRRLDSLAHEVALIPVKERIRSGDFAGARRAFLRHCRAMKPLRRIAVLALVLLSPRVYRFVARRIDPMAAG